MEQKKVNWFVRVLIIMSILLIVFLIFMSFYNQPNQFEISSGIVILLGLITLLILSEVYDNLSLGKIISVSRQINQIKEEKKELITENTQLRNQMIQTMQNFVNLKIAQLNSNTNINANGLDIVSLLKDLKVIQVQNNENEGVNEGVIEGINEDETQQETQIENLSEQNDFFTRRKFAKGLKKEVIYQYLLLHQLSSIELKTDVEFSENFRYIDPIMDKRIIFDGYLNYGAKEYFFGVIAKDAFLSTEKLYIQLAKIFFYKQFKNIDTELILIFVFTPNYERMNTLIKRVREYFQPALQKQLLRIEDMTLDEQQIEQLIEKFK
ncbi:MAG: hypothetical protein ACYDH2_00490 [Anaerolineaceae bacterium]